MIHSRFSRKFRSTLISIAPVILVLGIAAALIAYGRGYRLDFTKTSIKPTGLVTATSDPLGAQVFVDGKLTTATNNSFNLDPGWYTVRITKEGYIPWEKNLRVQGEVVTRADAFLFPGNPSLSPLTNTGITNLTLSLDGTKVAYIVPEEHVKTNGNGKAGLWVYELSDGTLGRNRDPKFVGTTSRTFPLDEAILTWSPDSTQILVQSGKTYRLYTTGKLDLFEAIVNAGSIRETWRSQYTAKELQKLAAYPQPIIDMASTSAQLISFSPDETKLLYEATASATIPPIMNPPMIGTNPTEQSRDLTAGNLYVYDAKEDRNYFLVSRSELPTIDRSESSPYTPFPLMWFPTSRHLVLTLPGKIDIMEYDRTNWVTVYSGPFEEGFLAPWPTGSRVVILTSLNQNASTLPNLYTVNLR